MLERRKDAVTLKNTMKQLKRNKEIYQGMVEGMDLGLVRFEPVYDNEGNPIDHRFLSANSGWIKMMDVNFDEMIDLPKEQAKTNTIFITEKDIDKDLKEQINVTSNISPNGSVIAKFTNQSDQTIDYISSYVLFYQGENLIGCTESGAYDLIPGSFGIAEYGSPFDSYYNNIPFDDYELVITSASQYNNPPQPELYR